jgi:hypothetical protein
VKGYVDTDKGEVYVEISVLGISIGSYDFTLADGLTININLFLVKGLLKFYVKDGKELWMHYELSVRFDGTWNGDVKIISW